MDIRALPSDRERLVRELLFARRPWRIAAISANRIFGWTSHDEGSARLEGETFLYEISGRHLEVHDQAREPIDNNPRDFDLRENDREDQDALEVCAAHPEDRPNPVLLDEALIGDDVAVQGILGGGRIRNVKHPVFAAQEL